MILYRPIGLQELELIYDGGMSAFPARLPQQPIFYPVLQLEYARKIALEWNAKNAPFAGYVTQFKVEDSYIDQFEQHTVGGSQHQEFWIPAEEMEEFNKHILGHIKVMEAHFGDEFQGFIPDQFGLAGKNVVEQFTLLANSYIYKRMEFFLEIKRNHKAVFLNYPFWQIYQFKNPGLKDKILQAIKEAWLASFPKIPLPLPVQQDTTAPKTDNYSMVDFVEEEIALEEEEQTDSDVQPLVNPVHQIAPPVKQTYANSLVNPVPQENTPHKQPASPPPPLVKPVQEASVLPTPTHFVQGLELSASGKDREAIAEFSKAVEQNPNDVVARTSLGVAFHRLGEDDRALSCYEAALRINPRSAETHYFRANIFHSRGDVREAITGYSRAIGLAPELIEAHLQPVPADRLTDYSSVPAELPRITKPAQRILALNQSLQANPRQPNRLKERAAEYSRLGNYEQAISDYTSCLAIQPDDAQALHLRGVAYEQIGQPDKAGADYRRAGSLQPQLADEYILRGVTLGQMGNLRQSIASLTEGIRLAPQNADAYFNRGTSHLQLGDFEKAIQDFSNVIQLLPNDEAAYYWRGISLEEMGRRREAITDYQKFLALSQDENARVEIEQRLSQWKEGKQSTNPVPAQEPDQKLDLYPLLAALGERALHSTWFGEGVECYGENAGELHTLTDQNQAIKGQDFLNIVSGIHQTMEGDFIAFDPGANSHWILIRAWHGTGFYIEIEDSQIKRRLKSDFQNVEEVQDVPSPYEGLFIPV